VGLLGFGGGAALRRVCLRWTRLSGSSPGVEMGRGGFGGGADAAALVDVGGGAVVLGTGNRGAVLFPDAVRFATGMSPGLSTLTQSGSELGVKGFEGLPEFRVYPFPGGLAVDRAGIPPSSHHFLFSELAGGRPGSTES